MSHHSSHDPKDDENSPIRKLMHEKMKEVFGEYPNGKLNANDEGGLAMALGVENGAVVMRFPKPVAWIGFTPEQAMQIASNLIKHARACGHTQPLSIQIGGSK
jgi:hypothetical protein